MHLIVVATASLYFTGRQEPLSFLKLCNTSHVFSCLLTKQGYKPLTLKRKQTYEILKILLQEDFSVKVSLKPSLKTAIHFKKNYIIEENPRVKHQAGDSCNT